MKVFVSYARVDKAYCVRIIDTLGAHDVWYDQRLYAGQDWWQEILRRLDWCDAFIYLLSPDSVASLYCRREFDIARRLNRQVIPVLINRDTVLPDQLRDWQYVDLSRQLTVENVTQLLNAILVAERRGTPEADSATTTPPDTPSPVDSTPGALVSDAVRALENGEYDNAIVLLKQAEASGYQSRFVRLDELLRKAETVVAKRAKLQDAKREYQRIASLFAVNDKRQMACDALRKFAAAYGDYDPQRLRRLCVPTEIVADIKRPESLASPIAPPSPTPATREPGAAIQTIQPAKPKPGRRMIDARRIAEAPDSEEILPLLHWRDIPYGMVTISSMVGGDEDFGEMTAQVDNFVMSQYPVTNGQFAIFAAAPDGYKNGRWWQFSEHAAHWHKGKTVAESRFAGEKRPRENVNWYEAMAFCGWLGSMLKMRVCLPTIAQWQRAAKGDDDRYYPWGDDYNEAHCNTLESGLKTTTPVDRYHKGVSPYGVYDMAGNIWEWTLNTAAAAETGRDQRRAVAGGSFVSPCDRAQTAFRYYLDPRVRYSSIGIRLVGLP